MKLSPQEIFALNEWMRVQGLTLRAVAGKIGTKHTGVLRWRRGGGIAPSAHAKLAAAIAPFAGDQYLIERLRQVKEEIETSFEELEKTQSAASFARHRLEVAPDREHKEHTRNLRQAELAIPKLEAKLAALYEDRDRLLRLQPHRTTQAPEAAKTDKEKLIEMAAENFKLKEELSALKTKLTKLEALQKLFDDFKVVFSLGKS